MNFFPFHNNRDFSYTVRYFKHLIKLIFVLNDIYVNGALVSRPGFSRIGSTRLAVNNDFTFHDTPSLCIGCDSFFRDPPAA
jgi:hypothetical protein